MGIIKPQFNAEFESVDNFLTLVFLQLFRRIREQHHILRFFIPILLYFFFIILQLFTNFEYKRGETAQKKKKLFLKM
jgi:hypothetical protein